MYYSANINSDGVGLLGNKLFIIATCKSMNLKIGYHGFFIPPWDYQKCFPSLTCSDLVMFSRLDTSYHDPKFSYTEIPLLENNTHLFGYFQSEKYFKEHRKEILEMFEPNSEIKFVCNDVFKEYEGKRISSIHIRRGDYVNLPDFHPLCDIQYYNTAMELLKDDTDLFMVFSDDIQWAKDTFRGNKFIFSEDHTNVTDMFLMSNCDNHIIANSSFSWWGSYLNTSETKKTIAPKNWFGKKGPQDWQDVYRNDMIVI